MYIEPTTTYYGRDGTQRTTKARFLILMRPPIKSWATRELRAVVRKVSLKQVGTWMMGRATIGKKVYTMSGSYGNDGMPIDVDEDTYRRGVLLPAHLYKAWSEGGGHNNAGTEAPAVRDWAVEKFIRMMGPPIA